MDIDAMMAATAHVNLDDVLHDCRPLLVVYKDGRIERFLGLERVPPSVDSITGVESKDVVINPETGVHARLYKPGNVGRVGVLEYYHGGGFCIESAFSPLYHNYCNNLSFEANMVIVSVEYRLAPESDFSNGYEDCWDALKWVFKADHHEPWIRDCVDLSRVFLAGDSAGGNIVHNMAKRAGKSNTPLRGVLLVHPYFFGKDKIGSEEKILGETGWTSLPTKVWSFAYPSSSGLDDPQIDPGMDRELGELGVDKVMVCVAEKDILRDRGFYYKDLLLKSGWKGNLDFLETLEEDHVFHLFDPDSQNSHDMMKQVVAFLNS